MTKQSWRSLPTPQLLQPRTMRFAADEIIANLLGIPPIGQYAPEVERERENPSITDAWAERIIAESAAREVPPLRGREWAQRVAGEAIRMAA